MHTPLHRPLYGPIATAITDARVSGGAEPEAVTWDADNKGEDVVLSNGDLTAAVTTSVEAVRATQSHASGSHCFGITLNANNYAYIGVCAEGFDASDAPSDPYAEGVWTLSPHTGYVFSSAGAFASDFEPAIAGEEVFVFHKPIGGGNAGLWFDTVDDLTAVDREAGTNPHMTIPAGAVYPVAILADPATTADLDPDHDSGTFAAWSPA